ncbi:hypothetical protein [Methylobacterium sp. NFXW15]|uniref:hypothetical protein n=1 Tax=Methylobacterium sp. NFXW15 TaxID=2819512 RepID=UPI003CE70952
MPAISMCPSENCPARRDCYRNEASGTRPNPWRQDWADWTWSQPGGGPHDPVACDGLWLLDGEVSLLQQVAKVDRGDDAP